MADYEHILGAILGQILGEFGDFGANFGLI
jgi:hypothetical protein